MKTTTEKKKPRKKAKPKTIPEFRVVWKKASFQDRLHMWASNIWSAISQFPNEEYPTVEMQNPRPFSWLANTTWTSSELK